MKHKLLSIALITILLFMVLGNCIGCTGPGGGTTQYTLTTTSTAGGTVTTPGVGTYTYNASQVVNLVATPNSGYRFVNWTGNVGTIANVTAASTTITMSGNYTITANFALGTLIANVPDTNWTGANPANYCAPLAMVNILGYWDEVMGRPNAYNVTAWQQPSNLNTVANYVGWFMDTNWPPNPARGNGLAHVGTYAKDITPGNVDYVLWDAAHLKGYPGEPGAIPPWKVSHVWTGFNDYFNSAPQGFPFVEAEINAGRPLVVCYWWWVLNMTSGINVTDPQSGKVISVYQWGPMSNNSTYPPEQWNYPYYSGELCIGHAVTCVGYILNWDPDGSGTVFSQGNYTIVHDTWSTTPENIAVLWPGPWNSSHSVLP